MPLSSTPASSAGGTAQLRGRGKSPKIARLAHYNFAHCGVGGRWHAWALHACCGNALFDHVFRSCGCHRAAAGLGRSSKAVAQKLALPWDIHTM